MTRTDPVLEVAGVGKRFAGLRALDGVSLAVPPRSILGIIGMNGSGKTTLLNCINGLYAIDEGDIHLEGRSIARQRPEQIAAAGVGRTFQVPKVFARLTLLDNLEVPQIPAGIASAEAHRRSVDWLGRVRLLDLAHNFAEELSGGQQKLLELARIMVTRPRLVLLDEPFAGVNPELALLLIDVIRTIPGEHDCAVVLVSHDLTSIYRLSDHIVVLNEGRVLCEGDAQAVRTNPAVIEAYLGTDE